MKTIIYLPLIALIFLCSCKSNSFMNQRYTKFGHAHHKTNPVKKDGIKALAPDTERSEIVVTEETQTANASAETPLLLTRETFYDPIRSAFKNSNSNIAKKETKEVENAKPEIKNKKAVEKKRSAAQRVIGTLLKIVLWIIILAVVVGVIIIIAALA